MKNDILKLAVVACVCVFIGGMYGYYLGASSNEQKHKIYKGDKALLDKTVELYVANMPIGERNEYLKRMLKPLEADSDSRVLQTDNPFTPRCVDTCNCGATDRGRHEENQPSLPLTQEQIWTVEGILDGQ